MRGAGRGARGGGAHLHQLVPVLHGLAGVGQHLRPVLAAVGVSSIGAHAAHADHLVVPDAGGEGCVGGEHPGRRAPPTPMRPAPGQRPSPVIVDHRNAEPHVLHALGGHVEHQRLVVRGVQRVLLDGGFPLLEPSPLADQRGLHVGVWGQAASAEPRRRPPSEPSPPGPGAGVHAFSPPALCPQTGQSGPSILRPPTPAPPGNAPEKPVRSIALRFEALMMVTVRRPAVGR